MQNKMKMLSMESDVSSIAHNDALTWDAVATILDQLKKPLNP